MQNTSRGGHILIMKLGKGAEKASRAFTQRSLSGHVEGRGAIIASGKMQGERGEGVGGPCVGGHAGTRVVRTQGNKQVSRLSYGNATCAFPYRHYKGVRTYHLYLCICTGVVIYNLSEDLDDYHRA